MTDFPFDVDDEYARKHNEFLRDAKRMQISAAILAAILIAVIAITFAVVGVKLLSIAVGISLGFFALLCLILIPVLPKQMGNPQEYYNMYKLAPAIIAEVNPRDMVIMCLANANGDEANPNKDVPALVLRTVTSIPGVPRELGVRVPCVAVTGYRPSRGPKVYEEISPMPIAWGTPHEKVWKEAERAIPTNKWKRLESSMNKLDDVKKTRRNVLVLEGNGAKK